MKVLLADKREIFREGLAKILEGEPNIEVVCTCSSGLQVIDKASQLKPDIILIDTEITECDYVEAIRRTVELLPETGVIILTHSEKDQDLFSAMKAGAKAYMTKDVRVEELVKAIALVNAGGIIISPPMAAKLLHEFPLLGGHEEVSRQRYDSLSKREREVLNLVAKGATNVEIGTTLFITENTVKTHMRKIIDKLRVRNRQQAAALVLGKRLVSNAD